MQTRNYILMVKQKFSDFPLLRSFRYKIRIFNAYVEKQWVKKRRVPVWARSVSVGDDCNIVTNIYPHLHSREPTLVPHPHPPDYLKLSIDSKRTCLFWIYFNSTWCWCICAATINKNKSFSKETLSGLPLSIFSALFWRFSFWSFPRRPYLSPYISLSLLTFIHWKISEVLCRHFNW